MATDVAVLVARLEADIRDFDKDLKKASKRLDKLDKSTKKVGKTTDSTAKSMKKMGGQMKAVFAGAAAVAVFKFLKGAVDASSDLNESINAVNVVFGEASEGVKKLGEDAAASMGLANAEFNTLAVSFSSFVEKIVGPGGDVVGTLEVLTQRAADFASVMNIDVAEAATIFRSGLAGETEPLRKFGIDLSAAAVNAEALASGLAESTSEITEQDKILARYKLLMDQTEKTSGDFANTSGDFANAMRILGAEFENAKAELGDALIPELEKLVPIARRVVELVVDLAPAVGSAAESFADLVENSLPLIEAFGFLVVEYGKFIQNNKLLIDSENPFDQLVGGVTELASKGALPTAIAMVEQFFGLFNQEAPKAAEDLLNIAGAARTAGRDSHKGAEGVEEMAEELSAVEKAAKNARKEIVTYIAILQASLDPALAAANSLIALQEAHVKVDEILAAETVDTEALALAQLELASQILETQGKLDALDATGVQNAIDTIGKALELSDEDARAFLETLGLIDGLKVTVVLDVFGAGGAAATIREIERIVALAPPQITMHQGGIVPGPPGADVPIVAQAGERIIPTSQASQGVTGGGDVNITIEGDLTEPVFEDLQRELILDSIGRFVETR